MKENITKNYNIIGLIKKILYGVMVISVILEMIFFPSYGNLAGCLMMIISCCLFNRFFLKRYLIVNAPFSFFMFCSMFLFRYLPLPATLLEGKPVSYGMVYPIKTFFLETVMFGISCLAFYIATKNLKHNNIVQKVLNVFGFYKQENEKTYWILGLIGCIARILSLAMGQAETGNIVGRALYVLFYYMYLPVILFFPCLYDINSKKKINIKKKSVWIYILFISILNLATNSRNKLITPFCIIVLLSFLSLVLCDIRLNKILKPSTVIKTMIIVVICLEIFSITSKAMLINRSIREDISFTELIKNTISTVTNPNIDSMWNTYENKNITFKTYTQGWTEEYVDNYLLNRFCNIRITDETLYLGTKLGNYGKEKMLEDFKNRIIAAFPQPVLKIFTKNFNKENYYNARGDALYIYSGVGADTNWGEFRVTSNLGDGLATFGVLYFPLQFVTWYFVMLLLNTFSINSSKNKRIYSIYGLLAVYTSMLKFVNGNGMLDDILFFIRGYWQEIFLFIFIYYVARVMSLICIKR